MDTSHLAQHGALFASIFVVATTTMKTMIPLRVFGILANVVLILTAIPSHSYLVMFVQAVMLVVNSWRLHQMLQLVRDVKKSVNSDLSMDWLKPFMTERNCAAGEILFQRDVGVGMADEAVVAVAALALGAGEGVLLAAFGVKEDREILTHRAEAARQHLGGRGADHHPVAVLHRSAEQGIAHRAADDIGFHPRRRSAAPGLAPERVVARP